jgi:probable F420-dependent oxidoreductase
VNLASETRKRPLFGFEPFGGLRVEDRFRFRDSVQALEDLGADSLWTPGQIIRGCPVPEALVSLARMATLSTRARVGTNVLPIPLYHPVILAKQIAELDLLAGGRLTLGIGVGGEYPDEYAACQVPLDERGARANEAIELMRNLWEGGVVSHLGPTWPVPGAKIEPGPAQKNGPPIVVAGHSQPALRRAARLGDGWMPYFLTPDRYSQMRRQIIALAEAAGRDTAGFEWMYMVMLDVGDDDATARRRSAAVLRRARAEGDAADRETDYYLQPDEGFLDLFGAVGAPGTVVRRLQEYVDAGVEHFVVVNLVVPGGDEVKAAERVMREVVPAFRPD